MMSKYGFNTTKQRSDLMSKIKGKDTKPEIIIRKALWHEGIRYKKSNYNIIGKPDITIRKFKIAIFVDGEFWHGYNWEEKKRKIKTNKKYWIEKIEKNIQRDFQNNLKLKEEGWLVLRFWANDVKKNLNECLALIKKELIIKSTNK